MTKFDATVPTELVPENRCYNKSTSMLATSKGLIYLLRLRAINHANAKNAIKCHPERVTQAYNSVTKLLE